MRRRGMTLIEVLVAIFVMGIGLIAILALFPIGVLRMMQSMQDGRTGNIGISADSIAILKDIRRDSLLTSPVNYFISPGGGLAPALDDSPSFPIFVDPAGYRTALPGLGQDWLGGTPGIPRRSVSFVTSTASAVRWFSFLDDMYFDQKGTWAAPYDREYRYTWAYLLQRPRTVDSSIVNMAVVVFNRRSLALSNNLDLPETVYTGCKFDTKENMVKITWAGTKPAVRAGEWILDATRPSDTASVTYPHGYFYRVVNLTDFSANEVHIEVQTPLRGFPNPPSEYSGGRVIILEGIAEVFERGDGRIP